MGATILFFAFIVVGFILNLNQFIAANPTKCITGKSSLKGKIFEGKALSTSIAIDKFNASTIHVCHHVCRYNCNCTSVAFYGWNSSNPENCYLYYLYNITQHFIEDQSASVTYFGLPKDCLMASKKDCVQQTNIYDLGLHNNTVSVPALCDMNTEGGGWTFLQKRFDGSVDFYLDWSAYKHGFGDLNGEFWLGLDTAHELMKDGNSTLRFDLWDGYNNHRYAEYYEATISDEAGNYRLDFTGYSGNAGDSLTERHEGRKFTTKDRDNDIINGANCAVLYTGAWWYSRCHYSNLNGKYGDSAIGRGLNWYTWKQFNYSLSKSEIKFKRNE